MTTHAALPILVAAVPIAAARLRSILPSDRVLCAASYHEARQQLSRERYALAILGVYFDESRMFDLLSFARTSATNRDTPVVCVLGIRGRLSDVVVRSLEHTINSMPLAAFLNLAAIPDDAGGNASVRRFLDSYLLPSAGPAQLDVARA